ncbi:translation initiation factor eIF-1A [Candidatus Micrarchaeota archaeon]|nr:translation initiation factor eIF-1A [Candidatus Micrarchaeota archaeon]
MGFYRKPRHKKKQNRGDQPFRLRLPREGELFGVVRELVGGSRLFVNCEDGKERLCRIPGRIRMKLWMRSGDIVLITPWVVESDEKADIAYRYTRPQVEQLVKKGLLRI